MGQEHQAEQKERQTRGEVAHAFLRDLWPQWRPTRQQSLWAARITIVSGVLIALVFIGYSQEWTGFGRSVSEGHENQDIRRMKTLWDWLKLLIVPAVLALGAYLFTGSENRRTERIADQGAMDTALQSYLDQMSVLLIDKHLHGEYRPHGDTRVTARARTLTVLEGLDGGRKRSVLQFLREARLINRTDEDLEGRMVYARVVGLGGADLTDADLKGVKLRNASLKGANLRGADLRGARYDAETTWPQGLDPGVSGAAAG